MKQVTGAVVVMVVGMFASGVQAQNKQVMKMDFAKNRVVAHRGAWKANNLPQNSIASLQQAVALGCTGAEFDVHMTADDSLVINHDDEYDGKTIGKTNYAGLITTPLSNGEPLPTLQNYLLAGIKQYKTQLVLELKPSVVSKERGILSAEKVVNLVRQLKAQPWITYISFDYDIVKKIHEMEPAAPVQYLNGDKSPEELKQDGIMGADYQFKVFQEHPEWIAEAKKLGVVLNTWTVNDPVIMDWFIGHNFDFITTNEPELLFERLKAAE